MHRAKAFIDSYLMRKEYFPPVTGATCIASVTLMLTSLHPDIGGAPIGGGDPDSAI